MGRNLANYYRKIFALVQNHHYSIMELESLPIFEFEIYFDLVEEHIQKQKEAKLNSSKGQQIAF